MHTHACVYDTNFLSCRKPKDGQGDLFFSYLLQRGKQTMMLNKAFLHLSLYHDVIPPGAFSSFVVHFFY